jgi:hypothetical protein
MLCNNHLALMPCATFQWLLDTGIRQPLPAESAQCPDRATIWPVECDWMPGTDSCCWALLTNPELNPAVSRHLQISQGKMPYPSWELGYALCGNSVVISDVPADLMSSLRSAAHNHYFQLVASTGVRAA